MLASVVPAVDVIDAVTAVDPVMIRHVQHVHSHTVPLLRETSSPQALDSWIQLVRGDSHVDHLKHLSNGMRHIIGIRFRLFARNNPSSSRLSFDEMDKDLFCTTLKSAFSDCALGNVVGISLASRLNSITSIAFDLSNNAIEIKTIVDVSSIYDEFRDPSGVSTVSFHDELEAVNVLNGLLPKNPWNWRLLVGADKAQSVSDWLDLFDSCLMSARHAAEENLLFLTLPLWTVVLSL